MSRSVIEALTWVTLICPLDWLRRMLGVRTAATVCFLEGPAVDAAGTLFFSDITGNRILKMTPDGAVSVFRARQRTNQRQHVRRRGTPDQLRRGRVWPGRPAAQLVRTDMQTGQVEVLAERFEGKRSMRPTTCASTAADASGSPIPTIGTITPVWKWAARRCIASTAQVRRVVSQPQIGRPNGLAITPDDKTLYVVDSHSVAGGNRKIWAFDVADDGTLSGQRLVYDFGRGRGGDGMRLDRQGNLWIAAGVLTARGPARNRRSEDGDSRCLARRQAARAHPDSRRRADEPDVRRAGI